MSSLSVGQLRVSLLLLSCSFSWSFLLQGPVTVSPIVLRSSAAPTAPARTAPDAGYVPEWEGRKGLTEDEFLNSDPSMPDVGADLLECPRTRWDETKIDLDEVSLFA